MPKTFSQSSMRRIAETVRTVEAMPAELARGSRDGTPDREDSTVGVYNGLGRRVLMGECLTLGAWLRGDVYTAATPSRASDLVVVAIGYIDAGRTARAWISGARLVRYRERSDSYGGTIAAPTYLGPVPGQTYLSFAPFGEFELLRIATAASAGTDGLAWALMLRPAMSKCNTITTAGGSPKILSNLDITTT